MARSLNIPRGFEVVCNVVIVWQHSLSNCSWSIMLTILPLHAGSTSCFGTCSWMFVTFWLLVCPMVRLGGLSQYLSLGSGFSVERKLLSDQSTVSRFHWIRISLFRTFFGFSHAFMATGSSTCVTVAVIFAHVASEPVHILTVMASFVFFGATIKTGLRLDGTNFFGCGNMPRIF